MGFVKLKFVPPYFPVGLLLFYWAFFVLFYVFYLPVYFLLWLFSPYKSKKSRLRPFARKTSDSKRDLTSKPVDKGVGKDA
jgi:hypothetical protein